MAYIASAWRRGYIVPGVLYADGRGDGFTGFGPESTWEGWDV